MPNCPFGWIRIGVFSVWDVCKVSGIGSKNYVCNQISQALWNQRNMSPSIWDSLAKELVISPHWSHLWGKTNIQIYFIFSAWWVKRKKRISRKWKVLHYKISCSQSTFKSGIKFTKMCSWNSPSTLTNVCTSKHQAQFQIQRLWRWPFRLSVSRVKSRNNRRKMENKWSFSRQRFGWLIVNDIHSTS